MEIDTKKFLKAMIIIYSLILLYFSLKIENIIKLFFGVIITILVLGLNWFIILNKKMEVHEKFGIVAFVFGIILIFIIPVLHGIDEGAHFFKVYSLINNCEEVYEESGKLIDKVPRMIIEADMVGCLEETTRIIGRKIDSTDTILVDNYIGAKLYSPLSYITYLLPMFLCKNIGNMDIYSIIILGRVFSFFIWLIVSMYTIKIMPKKKEFIAFLCLMPIYLTLVTTYTGDLVNNMVISLFIAIWYRLYEEKREIKNSEIVAITILGIISACTKMVYALIFFIIFLLPIENFKSKKHKQFITVGIILILIITFFLNMSVIGKDLLDSYPAIDAQKSFVLNNPFQYVYIFIRTIIVNFPMYLYQFTTGLSTMCQNSISVDNVLSLACFMILIYSLLNEYDEIKLTPKAKRFIVGIVILMISIIFLSLYLQWTATEYGVGHSMIMGVQGRYFIPIAVLSIFINFKVNCKVNKNFLWTSMITINFIILLKIICHF